MHGWTWRDYLNALLGLCLLLGIIAGCAWLLVWTEGVFGSESSGLFPHRNKTN